jgi:hypothetical protein
MGKPAQSETKFAKDELNEQDLEKVSGGTIPTPKGTSKDESTKEEVTFEYGGLQLRY